MVGLSISVLALISLTIDPQQSLTSVLIHLGAVGLGIGTVYPVATVAVQNAVPRHQLGIATGTMNFFRALLSAVIVAGLGAIILGGINLKGGGQVAAVLHASGGSAELALVFRWVFAACGGDHGFRAVLADPDGRAPAARPRRYSGGRRASGRCGGIARVARGLAYFPLRRGWL